MVLGHRNTLEFYEISNVTKFCTLVGETFRAIQKCKVHPVSRLKARVLRYIYIYIYIYI